MTDPVIRALTASDAHLFDAQPDPLGAREGHRRTRYRPDWKRVALRDGTVVARGAWWGGARRLGAHQHQLVRRGRGRGGGGRRTAALRPLAGRTRDQPARRLAGRARPEGRRRGPLRRRARRRLRTPGGALPVPLDPGTAACPSGPDGCASAPNPTTRSSSTRCAASTPSPWTPTRCGPSKRAASTRPPRRNWTSSTGARLLGSGGRSRTRRRATWPASTSRPTIPPVRPSASSASSRNSAATVTPTTSSRSAPTSSSSRARSSSAARRTRATSRWPRTSPRRDSPSSVSASTSMRRSRCNEA